eukprot:7172087-Prymnesium_polylepis.1
MLMPKLPTTPSPMPKRMPEMLFSSSSTQPPWLWLDMRCDAAQTPTASSRWATAGAAACGPATGGASQDLARKTRPSSRDLKFRIER